MQQNIYSLLHLAQLELGGNPEFFIKRDPYCPLFISSLFHERLVYIHP